MNRREIQRELGRRVRQARNEKGVAKDVLARDLGMSPGKMYRLESGLLNPTLTTLARVCEALDIKLDHLFKGIA
jgi:transcriptional regulator with XRE-family HTH domain